MSQSAQRTSFWQAVKDRPGRTPLRVKLIAAVLALVIAALALISFAGISYIRDYLLNRADSELQDLRGSTSGAYGLHVQSGFGPRVGEQPLIEAISPAGHAYPGPGFQLRNTDPKIPLSRSWLASNALQPTTVPAQTGGDRWRVIVQPGQQIALNNGQTFTGTIVVGLNVTDVYATIGRLIAVDLLVSLGIVLILTLIAAGVVRASLRPLTDIEKTAGAIAAGDLSRRVPERDPRTEVGRLGRSLNAMLSQIETAFRSRTQSEAAARRSEEKMRQFVADASHELRTPLTAIRGFAEYYRQRGGIEAASAAKPADAPGVTAEATGTGASAGARSASGAGRAAGAGDNASKAGNVRNAGSASTAGKATEAATEGASRNGTGQLESADMDRIMRRVEQESSRMGVLVEDMLLLARLDQQRPLDRRPVDLLTLAADAVHDARVVAPSRSINLTVGSGAALLVIGDEVRLRQVIGNLMSNALSHTPDGTPIDVLIRSGNLGEAPAASGDNEAVPASQLGKRTRQPAAVLEVTDHGPGLTREQAEHVFERFYRADQARTSGGGTGLGLAIVAALVAAHGGAAWVRTQPGSGATFCIALPLTPEAAQGANESDDPGEEAATADAEHITGEKAA